MGVGYEESVSVCVCVCLSLCVCEREDEKENMLVCAPCMSYLSVLFAKVDTLGRVYLCV